MKRKSNRALSILLSAFMCCSCFLYAIPIEAAEGIDYTNDAYYTLLTGEDFESYSVSTGDVKEISSGGIVRWQARVNAAMAIKDSGSTYGKVLDLRNTSGSWNNVAWFTALQNDAALAEKLAAAKYVKVEYDVAMKSAVGDTGSFAHAGVVANNAGGSVKNYAINMFGSAGSINQRENNASKATDSAWTKDTWVTMTNYIDVENAKFNTRVNGGALAGEYAISSSPDGENVGTMTAKQLLTIFFKVNYHASAPGEAWFDNVKVYIGTEKPTPFELVSTSVANNTSDLAVDTDICFTMNRPAANVSEATVAVTENGNSRTDCSLRAEGSKLYLEFADGLQYGGKYTVTIQGLKDALGVECAAITLNFSTLEAPLYAELTGNTVLDYTEDSAYTQLVLEDFESYTISDSALTELQKDNVKWWTAHNGNNMYIVNGNQSHGQVLDLKNTGSAWNAVARFAALQNDSAFKPKLANAEYVRIEYDAAMQSALNASGSYMHNGVVANGKNYSLTMFGSSGAINQRNNNASVATGSTWSQGGWTNLVSYVDVKNAKFNTRVNGGSLKSELSIDSHPNGANAGSGTMSASALDTIFFMINYNADPTKSGEVWIDNVKISVLEAKALNYLGSSVEDGATDVSTEAQEMQLQYSNALAKAKVSVKESGKNFADFEAEIDGGNVLLDFGDNLTKGCTYEIRVQEVEDIYGNTIEDKTISFSTVALDVFTLTGSSLTNGMKHYGISKDLPMTFTYNSKIDTDLFSASQVQITSDGTPFTDFTVVVEGNTVKIILSKDLSYSTSYTVTVGALTALGGTTATTVSYTLTTVNNILEQVNLAESVSSMQTVLAENQEALMALDSRLQSRHFNANLYQTMYEQKPYTSDTDMIEKILLFGEVLDKLNETSYMGLPELLATYQDIILCGCDKAYQEYVALSGTAVQNAINSNIVQESDFLTFAEFRTRFKDKLKDGQEGDSEGNSGSSSDRGGSSGSGGNFGSSGIAGYTSQTTVAPAQDTSDTEDEKNETQTVFTDLNEAAWATESITALYGRGIVAGDGNGLFRPTAPVTREEFVKMVVLALDIPLAEEAAVFTDIDANAWYVPYVSAAYDAGIIKGKTDGSFGIGEQITREDMAVMVYRAVEKAGKTLAAGEGVTFLDAASISDYARDAVQRLQENEIVSGTGDGCFEPKAYAGRAEAVQIIYNLLAALAML